MTEHEVRLLVREAIARQIGHHAQPWSADAGGPSGARDASHGQFDLPALGSECIIEPSVTCNHCGYCKSYGH